MQKVHALEIEILCSCGFSMAAPGTDDHHLILPTCFNLGVDIAIQKCTSS
jgi:hypothetical protein